LEPCRRLVAQARAEGKSIMQSCFHNWYKSKLQTQRIWSLNKYRHVFPIKAHTPIMRNLSQTSYPSHIIQNACIISEKWYHNISNSATNNVIVSVPHKEWLPDLDSSLRTMNTKQPQAALWWFVSRGPSGTRRAQYWYTPMYFAS
jgi:hypothetical protein